MAEPVATTPADRSEPDRFAGKRLIVGEGIRLSGEISSCDRLIVEGEVEVTLNDTLALEIASSGRFTGGCEVEEADISGVYEGDLTVRNRLIVRGSGKLTGTVRYGELELERGGQIAGNISVLGNEAERGASAAASGGRSALFGGADRERRTGGEERSEE
ncbi:MAG TPA: polymer-forming cytoskeletal protein [Geminicoccaceae bacterium]